MKNKFILCAVIVFCCVTFTHAQKHSPAITNAKGKQNTICFGNRVPGFMGFEIGQTPKQIDSLIPRFSDVYKDRKAWALRPDHLDIHAEAGLIMIDDNDVLMNDPSKRTSKFKNINFTLHFYEDKLFGIYLQYQAYDPKNINMLIQKVASELKLPRSGWSVAEKNDAKLKCGDYALTLWTGRVSSRPDYREYPMVSVSDVTVQDILNKRKDEILKRRK